MTNPNNAIGTNGAYGGRTSVEAFNDDLALYSGRGRLSGFVVSPDSGMTVSLGGDGTTRDVAIAEDNTGNKTTINNISGSPISVSIDAAPASNSRIDAIVAYVDNPPQGTSSSVDNPGACGLIVAKGTTASSPIPPSEAMIRTAITADGASGTTAFYAIVGYVRVPNGTTDITGNLISQGPLTAISANAIQTGAITTAKIANNAITTPKIADGAVTSDKIDWATIICSTTEKVVGTDYDNKTIYERTFYGSGLSLSADTSNSFTLIANTEPKVPTEIVQGFGHAAGIQYSGGPVIQYGLGAIRISSGSVTWASNIVFSSSGSLQLQIFSHVATTGTAYYRVTVRYKY